MYRLIIVLSIVCTIQAMGSEMPNKPILLFVKGPACAGKSTICAHLAQQNNWKRIDEDRLIIKSERQIMQILWPDYFKTIKRAIAKKNIFHAVKRNQICFIKHNADTRNDAAMKAIKGMRNELQEQKERYKEKFISHFITTFKNALEHSSYRDKNIVIDSTWITPQRIWQDPKELEQKFNHFDMRTVLVYAPLSRLVKRLRIRNEDAYDKQDMRENRFRLHVIKSFVKFFKVSTTHLDNNAIDTCLQSELAKCLNEIHRDIVEDYAQDAMPEETPEKEMSEAEFEDFKKKLLIASPQTLLDIVPAVAYDVLIHNKLSLEQSVSSILSFFKERS